MLPAALRRLCQEGASNQCVLGGLQAHRNLMGQERGSLHFWGKHQPISGLLFPPTGKAILSICLHKIPLPFGSHQPAASLHSDSRASRLHNPGPSQGLSCMETTKPDESWARCNMKSLIFQQPLSKGLDVYLLDSTSGSGLFQRVWILDV